MQDSTGSETHIHVVTTSDLLSSNVLWSLKFIETFILTHIVLFTILLTILRVSRLDIDVIFFPQMSHDQYARICNGDDLHRYYVRMRIYSTVEPYHQYA